MLALLNSENRWVRWGTVVAGLIGGALVWEVVG